jgi:hypoxanthine phosphoribosyltransferase
MAMNRLPGTISRPTLNEEEIRRRVAELGREISDDYRREFGKDAHLVAVTVLKGGFMFLADLIRHLDMDVSVDFLSITRFDQSTGIKGPVRITQDLSLSITGRCVLVVEDIVDTGLTLNYILKTLRAREPGDLRVCVLLDRTYRRIVPVEIRYRGFEIGEDFLVGYGLDYLERGRNLRDIRALMPGPGREEGRPLIL